MGPQTEDYIETVLTCEGNYYDPNFHKQLEHFSKKLEDLLVKGPKKKHIVLKKVEPWNSVKVTFNIPKDAALRLRCLAEQDSRMLRDLGILSIQMEEGDRKISLRLVGRNNETTELVLKTTSGTTAMSSTSETAVERPSMRKENASGGPSGVLPTEHISPASVTSANALLVSNLISQMVNDKRTIGASYLSSSSLDHGMLLYQQHSPSFPTPPASVSTPMSPSSKISPNFAVPNSNPIHANSNPIHANSQILQTSPYGIQANSQMMARMLGPKNASNSSPLLVNLLQSDTGSSHLSQFNSYPIPTGKPSSTFINTSPNSPPITTNKRKRSRKKDEQKLKKNKSQQETDIVIQSILERAVHGTLPEGGYGPSSHFGLTGSVPGDVTHASVFSGIATKFGASSSKTSNPTFESHTSGGQKHNLVNAQNGRSEPANPVRDTKMVRNTTGKSNLPSKTVAQELLDSYCVTSQSKLSVIQQSSLHSSNGTAVWSDSDGGQPAYTQARAMLNAYPFAPGFPSQSGNVQMPSNPPPLLPISTAELFSAGVYCVSSSARSSSAIEQGDALRTTVMDKVTSCTGKGAVVSQGQLSKSGAHEAGSNACDITTSKPYQIGGIASNRHLVNLPTGGVLSDPLVSLSQGSHNAKLHLQGANFNTVFSGPSILSPSHQMNSSLTSCAHASTNSTGALHKSLCVVASAATVDNKVSLCTAEVTIAACSTQEQTHSQHSSESNSSEVSNNGSAIHGSVDSGLGDTIAEHQSPISASSGNESPSTLGTSTTKDTDSDRLNSPSHNVAVTHLEHLQPQATDFMTCTSTVLNNYSQPTMQSSIRATVSLSSSTSTFSKLINSESDLSKPMDQTLLYSDASQPPQAVPEICGIVSMLAAAVELPGQTSGQTSGSAVGQEGALCAPPGDGHLSASDGTELKTEVSTTEVNSIGLNTTSISPDTDSTKSESQDETTTCTTQESPHDLSVNGSQEVKVNYQYSLAVPSEFKSSQDVKKESSAPDDGKDGAIGPTSDCSSVSTSVASTASSVARKVQPTQADQVQYALPSEVCYSMATSNETHLNLKTPSFSSSFTTISTLPTTDQIITAVELKGSGSFINSQAFVSSLADTGSSVKPLGITVNGPISLDDGKSEVAGVKSCKLSPFNSCDRKSLLLQSPVRLSVPSFLNATDESDVNSSIGMLPGGSLKSTPGDLPMLSSVSSLSLLPSKVGPTLSTLPHSSSAASRISMASLGPTPIMSTGLSFLQNTKLVPKGKETQENKSPVVNSAQNKSGVSIMKPLRDREDELDDSGSDSGALNCKKVKKTDKDKPSGLNNSLIKTSLTVARPVQTSLTVAQLLDKADQKKNKFPQVNRLAQKDSSKNSDLEVSESVLSAEHPSSPHGLFIPPFAAPAVASANEFGPSQQCVNEANEAFDEFKLDQSQDGTDEMEELYSNMLCLTTPDFPSNLTESVQKLMHALPVPDCSPPSTPSPANRVNITDDITDDGSPSKSAAANFRVIACVKDGRPPTSIQVIKHSPGTPLKVNNTVDGSNSMIRDSKDDWSRSVVVTTSQVSPSSSPVKASAVHVTSVTSITRSTRPTVSQLLASKDAETAVAQRSHLESSPPKNVPAVKNTDSPPPDNSEEHPGVPGLEPTPVAPFESSKSVSLDLRSAMTHRPGAKFIRLEPSTNQETMNMIKDNITITVTAREADPQTVLNVCSDITQGVEVDVEHCVALSKESTYNGIADDVVTATEVTSLPPLDANCVGSSEVEDRSQGYGVCITESKDETASQLQLIVGSDGLVTMAADQPLANSIKLPKLQQASKRSMDVDADTRSTRSSKRKLTDDSEPNNVEVEAKVLKTNTTYRGHKSTCDGKLAPSEQDSATVPVDSAKAVRPEGLTEDTADFKRATRSTRSSEHCELPNYVGKKKQKAS